MKVSFSFIGVLSGTWTGNGEGPSMVQMLNLLYVVLLFYLKKMSHPDVLQRHFLSLVLTEQTDIFKAQEAVKCPALGECIPLCAEIQGRPPGAWSPG